MSAAAPARECAPGEREEHYCPAHHKHKHKHKPKHKHKLKPKPSSAAPPLT